MEYREFYALFTLIESQARVLRTEESDDKKFNLKFNYLKANITKELKRIRSKRDEIKVRQFSHNKKQFLNSTLLYKQHIKPFLKNLNRHIKNGNSYFFSGKNGTGKTAASIFIARFCCRNDVGVYYIPFRAIINWHIQAFNDDNARSIIQDLYAIPVLIVDEIGKENKASDHTISCFEELIKKRESIGSTIFISNMLYLNEHGDDDIESFESRYGVSMVNIIQENYKVLEFDPRINFRTKHKVWR